MKISRPVAAAMIAFICGSLAACASEGKSAGASGAGGAESAGAAAPAEAASGAETWVRGLVEERTTAKGTLSEYTYYVIVCDDGRESILFNEKGFSAGFGAWAGTRVSILCAPSKGKLGFRKIPTEGLRAFSIEKADSSG